MTGDEGLQIGDCSLYGHVVYHWIRLKYYACLPVSTVTVAGNTRRAADISQNLCRDCGIFQIVQKVYIGIIKLLLESHWKFCFSYQVWNWNIRVCFFNCTFLRSFKKGGTKTKGKETKGRQREIKPKERWRRKMERRKQGSIQYMCTRTWQVEGDAAAHAIGEVCFAFQTAMLLCVRSVEPKISVCRVGALSVCLFHIKKWPCRVVNSWSNFYPILSSWR